MWFSARRRAAPRRLAPRRAIGHVAAEQLQVGLHVWSGAWRQFNRLSLPLDCGVKVADFGIGKGQPREIERRAPLRDLARFRCIGDRLLAIANAVVSAP